MLFGGIFVACDSSARAGNLVDGRVALYSQFFNKASDEGINDLFSSKESAIPLETPDFKMMQDNTLCSVATPCIVSGKVLGDVFGSNSQNQKEVIDYAVQPGDTLQIIADFHKISINTLLWANNLASSSAIKVGQTLVILPTDGVSHIVKAGDTISGIAQTYKAQGEDIISYNDLVNQDDIYIGDILIIPGGVMPKKASPVIANQGNFADTYVFPQGYIGPLGLHYYNAVDIVNNCGTYLFAAAAGTVQRAVGNGLYNQGMGNHITILHNNGVSTYYGHLMSIMPGIVPGASVYKGQAIALMGGRPGMAGAGKSTACHVHFQIMGAVNPLGKYPKGTTVNYK